MYEIFNMGIGMVLAVSPENVAEVQSRVQSFVIGKVTTKAEERVIIK
jgi:phosphoribosylformylglycinamidine cyclo-ligase